jgi:AmmeMemoRadiSam system protein A
MSPEKLTPEERKSLLLLARRSIEAAVKREPLPAIDEEKLTEALRADGATFVTLTIGGELRGCVGALQAYQPLANDVQEHAVAAALEDFRFPPVSKSELPYLEIEISRLTPPKRLEYSTPADLPGLLRVGKDGVILQDGVRRATFLPQVWEKVPEPEDFLSELCAKMGARYGLWREKKLEVWTYEVEEFHE